MREKNTKNSDAAGFLGAQLLKPEVILRI